MSKQKTLIAVSKKDDGFYWKVNMDLTGNEEDDECGPYDTLRSAMEDLDCFLEDGDCWDNI